MNAEDLALAISTPKGDFQLPNVCMIHSPHHRSASSVFRVPL
jgi:hypothetical protein